MLAIYVHDLSPDLIRFTDRIAVHWYGLAYVLGFYLCYLVMHSLAKRGLSEIKPDAVADFVTAKGDDARQRAAIRSGAAILLTSVETLAWIAGISGVVCLVPGLWAWQRGLSASYALTLSLAATLWCGGRSSHDRWRAMSRVTGTPCGDR